MMYLSFKHSTTNGPWYSRLLDKIIAARSNGPAVHTELVFSDGVSFSSSQWDKGVRFKQIDYVDDPKWVLVPVYITSEQESICREAAELIASVKLGYDWKGILGFMAGKKDPGSANKFFCSEVCVWVLQKVGVFKYLTPASTDPWLLECVAMERAEHTGPGSDTE